MNDDLTAPDLTAFVHGELDGARRRDFEKRLAAEPGLRAQAEALRAVDVALLDALETPQRTPQWAAVWTVWSRPLLAAAAVAIVATTLVLTRSDAGFASNELVSLRAGVHGGASQPIFTDVSLDLQWRQRGHQDRLLAVRPWRFGDTLDALGRAAAETETRGKVVPLVVSAVLHAPDGTRMPARLDAAVNPFRGEADQRAYLRDFVIETQAPPPYLGGRPDERQWAEDFIWAIGAAETNDTTPFLRNQAAGAGGETPAAGPRRFVLLDQPGEWTIELRVECTPPPEPGLWPSFDEPLVASVKVIATGVASEWGTLHDGLQARLLLATGCTDFDHSPLALQLRNVGENTRHYNVIGMTRAPVPQPFHMKLTTEPPLELEQRDDLPVVFGANSMMVPHPPGTVRSVVVCPDYWRAGGKPLGELDVRGLAATFHFEATLWRNDDTELWQGQLTTGRLVLPVRER
jgi:hypothetical protein